MSTTTPYDQTFVTDQGQAPAPAPAPEPAQAPTASLAPNNNANAFGITSFVLGIASIISSWTFIAPIIGLVLGLIALRRGTTERTLTLWGVWMNGILLALTALALIVIVALGALAIFAGVVVD